MAPPAELATSELNRHHFYGGLRDGMSGTADDHHSQRPRSRSSGPTVCRCGKSQLRKCRWGGPGHSLRDKRSRRAGRTSPLVEGGPLTAAPGNCHPAAAHPPGSIPAGHRPATSPTVRLRPGLLLYFRAVPDSLAGVSRVDDVWTCMAIVSHAPRVRGRHLNNGPARPD
jgi:hypothetical protein